MLHTITLTHINRFWKLLAEMLLRTDTTKRLSHFPPQLTNVHAYGSVAEWLACWTQAQKGLGSYRSRDAVG